MTHAAAVRLRSTRDWVVDAVVFVLAASWVAFAIVTYFDTDYDRPLWLRVADIGAGVLFCGALWFRRRWPVAIALTVLALNVFSLSAFAAWVIMLLTVVIHRPLTISFGVAAIAVAADVLRESIYPSGETTNLRESLLGTLFVVAVVLIIGLTVRARRQRVQSLRDRAARLETENHLRVAQARQTERARIAREMHDVLAHRLSLLCLHAGALEFRGDATSTEVAQAAKVIRASAHAALQDLREVIGVLRANTTDTDTERPQPTLADLTALVAESRDAGMHIGVHDTIGDRTTVPVALGRNTYRIVQEALTNARKHAPGTRVTVGLRGGPGDGLTVEVCNPAPTGGRHQPLAPGTGTGLIGVGERVALAAGKLEHGWAEDGDFRLWAWLPWPAS